MQITKCVPNEIIRNWPGVFHKTLQNIKAFFRSVVEGTTKLRLDKSQPWISEHKFGYNYWIKCSPQTRWFFQTGPSFVWIMMTSSNRNIFRVTGHLCGEFTGPRWISSALIKSHFNNFLANIQHTIHLQLYVPNRGIVTVTKCYSNCIEIDYINRKFDLFQDVWKLFIKGYWKET